MKTYWVTTKIIHEIVVRLDNDKFTLYRGSREDWECKPTGFGWATVSSPEIISELNAALANSQRPVHGPRD